MKLSIELEDYENLDEFLEKYYYLVKRSQEKYLEDDTCLYGCGYHRNKTGFCSSHQNKVCDEEGGYFQQHSKYIRNQILGEIDKMERFYF